jgi:hypothetical protein
MELALFLLGKLLLIGAGFLLGWAYAVLTDMSRTRRG